VQVELSGGRLDGTLVKRSALPPPVIWVDPSARFWRHPRADAELHMRWRRVGRRVIYEHRHFHYVICEGCGFLRHRPSCAVCGGEFADAA